MNKNRVLNIKNQNPKIKTTIQSPKFFKLSFLRFCILHCHFDIWYLIFGFKHQLNNRLILGGIR